MARRGLKPAVLQLIERIQRAVHYRLGPSRKQVEEAQRALSGREYYQLYDDVYRTLSDVGGSDDREQKLAGIRALVFADLEMARSRDLIPAPPATLIDIGCGEAHNTLHYARLGYRATGVDIAPAAIEQATRRAAKEGLHAVQFRVADALDLRDFADDSIDIATDSGCLHMLVRSEHREKYFRAVRRILRPGGALFLFQQVVDHDVELRDEEQEILKSITLVQKRFVANDGKTIELRGCGFRSASIRQYRQELVDHGFELVSDYTDGERHRGFAMLLARKPAHKPAPAGIPGSSSSL